MDEDRAKTYELEQVYLILKQLKMVKVIAFSDNEHPAYFYYYPFEFQ